MEVKTEPKLRVKGVSGIWWSSGNCRRREPRREKQKRKEKEDKRGDKGAITTEGSPGMYLQARMDFKSK